MTDLEIYKWNFFSDTELVDKNDYEIIKKFNEDYKNTRFEIRTELYPEPYIGDPRTAKVILLALNPGYDSSEIAWYNKHSQIHNILRDNLLHNVKEYPYYYLNEKNKNGSPGHEWFAKRTRELRIATELNDKQISERIATIQYFPYHSEKFKPLKNYLESQKYNFNLVLKAMENGKLIVCMRSEKLWNEALASISKNKNSLYDYRDYNSKKVIFLKNKRQPYLTTGNMEDDEFERIKEALNRK